MVVQELPSTFRPRAILQVLAAKPRHRNGQPCHWLLGARAMQPSVFDDVEHFQFIFTINT
jgi:hypothetical protein